MGSLATTFNQLEAAVMGKSSSYWLLMCVYDVRSQFHFWLQRFELRVGKDKAPTS